MSARGRAAIGWLLLTTGCGLAACFAARTVEGGSSLAKLENWLSEVGVAFGAACALMVLGALAARPPRKTRSPTDSAPSKPEAWKHFIAVRDAFGALPSPGTGQDPEFQTQLNAVLESDVPSFLKRREEMIADLGLLAFARVMSPFASFERNAARAWSASVDLATDESAWALERARDALAEAQRQWESTGQAGTGPPTS